MHELALAQGIVDIVAEQAARDGFTRARVVHLNLGVLSAVMPEALVFGFDSVSRGTAAEGARLQLERSPGLAWCVDCSKSVEVSSRLDCCPACGGAQVMITGGEQMRVTELEVD